MKNHTSKHCSDEVLIAWFDDELSWLKRWIARRHLNRCWECRTRLKDLEHCVTSLVRLKRDEPPLHPDDVDRLIRDLRVRRARQGDPAAPRFTGRRRVLAALLVAASILAVALALRPGRQRARVIATEPARRTLERSIASENWALLPKQALHQSFLVEVSQLGPVTRKRESRLEIWSEFEGHRRFALRWSSPDGVLKLGAWAPSAERRYVLNRFVANKVVAEPIVPIVHSTPLAEATTAEASLESLEAQFVQWLQIRPWTTVSLSRQFAEMCPDQAKLSTEEDTPANGQVHQIQLLMSRQQGNRRFIAKLQIDGASFRATCIEIRIVDRTGEAAIRIRSAKSSVVPEARLQPLIFKPDLPLEMAHTETAPIAPAGVDVSNSPAKPEFDHELENRVVVLEYLHQSGSHGDELAVGRRPDGGLLVEGIVPDARRREQVRSVVEGLLASQQATLHLVDAESGWPAPGKPVLDELHPLPAPTAGKKHPAETALYAYVIRAHQPEIPEVFVQKLTVLNWSLLTEAWALHSLGQTVSPAEAARLSPAFRDRLQKLAEDHRLGVVRHAGELRAHLESLGDDPGTDVPAPQCSSLPGGFWQADAERLFRQAQQFAADFQRAASASPAEMPSGYFRRMAGTLVCLTK